MVVPTMLGRILDVMEADGVELPALRHLSYGGGKMPVPVIERALALMPHVNFVNAYGLTETSSTIAVLTPDDHRDALASDDPAVRRRLGSVGPAVAVGRDLDPRPVRRAGRRTARPARSGSAASRSRASTSAARVAATGSPRATAATSTRGASCSSRAASTTSSCAAARTSRPARSRTCCASTRPSTTSPCTPSRRRSGARTSGRPSCLIGDVDIEELREWVRGRLRSTRVPAMIDVRTELPYNETGKLLRRVLKAEAAPG